MSVQGKAEADQLELRSEPFAISEALAAVLHEIRLVADQNASPSPHNSQALICNLVGVRG